MNSVGITTCHVSSRGKHKYAVVWAYVEAVNCLPLSLTLDRFGTPGVRVRGGWSAWMGLYRSRNENEMAPAAPAMSTAVRQTELGLLHGVNFCRNTSITWRLISPFSSSKRSSKFSLPIRALSAFRVGASYSPVVGPS